MSDIAPYLIEASLLFLERYDPNGIGFWKPSGEAGIITFTAPISVSDGPSKGYAPSQLFRQARNPDGSIKLSTEGNFGSLTRFYTIARSIVFGFGVPFPLDHTFDYQNPAEAMILNGSDISYGGFTFTWDSRRGYSANATNTIEMEQIFIDETTPLRFLTFTIKVPGASLVTPSFIPMLSRKPRKWGRSLTKRWQKEHDQLVAHRKFNRNTKRMKKNPNAGSFGKAGTESWKSKVYQAAKDTVSDAAMAGLKEGWKQGKKKAGKAAFDAIKKAVQSKLNKAKR